VPRWPIRCHLISPFVPHEAKNYPSSVPFEAARVGKNRVPFEPVRVAFQSMSRISV
jgi:hypothetical protein